MAGQILLLLTVLCCLYVFKKRFPDNFKDVKISIYLSAVIWVVGFMYFSAGLPHNTLISDISKISSLSFLLIAILMLIRELKPHMFRYPYLVVFIPILVPVSYLLVYQTNVIRYTILYSVTGIIIFVNLLFIIVYRNKITSAFTGIVGIILLSGALFYTIFLEYFIFYEFLFLSVISMGMIATVYSVSEALRNNNT